MPKISEVYGIAIYVYDREHHPPHFHAMYSGNEALIAFDTLAVLRGGLPPRAMGLVMEWASQHRDELRRVWDPARSGQPLDRIGAGCAVGKPQR